jgi:uncharacterized protein YjbI with pentapeptide repeats
MPSSASIIPTALALTAVLVVGLILFFYIRTFQSILETANAQTKLEFWKHIIQICAGAAVALGILVSGVAVKLQADQFLDRQKLEARHANNRQFHDSAEQLLKSDLSSTEASLVAFRDLLSADDGYLSSIELVLRATLVDLSENSSAGSSSRAARVRRIVEEYLNLFVEICNPKSAKRPNLSVLKFNQFDGRELSASNANFANSTLLDANFSKARLNCADFSTAILDKVNFNDASLRDARFVRARLSEASFVAANLEGADLAGASLHAANLAGANMLCANIRGANLSIADVDVYTLAESDFDAATELPKIITREQIQRERERRHLRLTCRR